MTLLQGIFSAIVTPFDQTGQLDIKALKTNFSIWNKTGLAGYLVLGSTGEVVHLEEEEKLEVLKVARQSIPSNMPMIVGTGLHSTSATIAFTKLAAKCAADYALVVTPHYFKSSMTLAALNDYYQKVADTSPIPVLLYSVPQFTGLSLSPELIAKLSEHPNIVGIKDSSGDMRVLMQTISLVKPTFSVLTGSAPILYPALAIGARGAILAVGNFAAKLCYEIFQAFNSKQLELAQNQQLKLLALSEQIASRYGVGGIKYAMDILGYQGKVVRSPLLMPDETAQKAIQTTLNNFQL
ncbi:MAG: dihydrodipicolinate synthase family protein [Acidobacteria bacterium]|nr:dihydrodipicolinate synthase family protein [Acidobacteriota bacterium]